MNTCFILALLVLGVCVLYQLGHVSRLGVLRDRRTNDREWMDLRVEKAPEEPLDLLKLLSVSICQELIQLFSENLGIGLIGIEFKECGGRHVHCVSQSNDQFE